MLRKSLFCFPLVLAGCSSISGGTDWTMQTKRPADALAACVARSVAGGAPVGHQDDALVVTSTAAFDPPRYSIRTHAEGKPQEASQIYVTSRYDHPEELKKVALCLPDPTVPMGM